MGLFSANEYFGQYIYNILKKFDKMILVCQFRFTYKKCKQLLNILKISISIFLCPCFRLNFCNLNTLFLIERSKSCQMKNNILRRRNEYIVRGQGLVYFLLPFKQRAYIVILAVAVCRREIFSVKKKIGNMQKSYKKIKIILLSTK